jgi:hypothetical protein
LHHFADVAKLLASAILDLEASKTDYYRVLGVEVNASHEKISKQYEIRRDFLHPGMYFHTNLRGT